jgi:hypothetical protein
MDDEGATRCDFARWFIDHDEVDEAARVLVPADELELGRSDSLDLAAALARRGLAASCEGRRLLVRAREELSAGGRKPPARIAPAPATAAKRTA